MAIDLSVLTRLTVQIDALRAQSARITDPGAKALIDAQVSMYEAQLSSEAQHMQSQADANSNILSNLGLFTTLNTLVGGTAPAIINLFK